jgi:hypothetical protein
MCLYSILNREILVSIVHHHNSSQVDECFKDKISHAKEGDQNIFTIYTNLTLKIFCSKIIIFSNINIKLQIYFNNLQPIIYFTTLLLNLSLKTVNRIQHFEVFNINN